MFHRGKKTTARILYYFHLNSYSSNFLKNLPNSYTVCTEKRCVASKQHKTQVSVCPFQVTCKHCSNYWKVRNVKFKIQWKCCSIRIFISTYINIYDRGKPD